jgi:hypothetical protein
MNEFFLIGADYLKGKSIYNPLRRALNLLFNVSITSYIYERAYGQYDWFNYSDYKLILNFFIKGNFFIPLSIFIGVYGITAFLSLAIFSSVNHFAVVRWTRQIISYQVKKESLEKQLGEFEKTTERVTPIKFRKDVLLRLYTEMQKRITPRMYERLQKSLQVSKNNLEATFHLAFRAFVAITIYFISIDYFGWLLYCLTCITLICGMYLVMLAYRFLDVFPTVISKFHFEAGKYISSIQQDIKETTMPESQEDGS